MKPAARDTLDAMLNAGAGGVAGLALLGASLLIGRRDGLEELGRFSELLAWFIVASQFAVGGLHYAALRESSRADAGGASRVAMHALAAVALLSLLVAAAVIALGIVLPEGPAGRDGTALALALALFAAGKVLVAALNGIGRMRSVAGAAIARGIGMLAGLAVTTPLGTAGSVVVGGELASTLFAATALLVHGGLPRGRFDAAAARGLLSFGVRAMPAGALIELNSRIDLLVLSAFATGSVVGAYGLALVLGDGFSLVAGAIRAQVLPAVARAQYRAELEECGRRASALARKLLIPSAILAVAAFPLLAGLVGKDPLHGELVGAWAALAIIALAWSVFGGGVSLAMSAMQRGAPGRFVGMMLLAAVANVATALVLVPLLGAVGAGVATAAGIAALSLQSRREFRRLRESIQ